MWNMKYFVIAVIIGDTGIVTKEQKRYMETIPGKHSVDFLQKKKIVPGASQIIRKVLQYES